MGGGILGKSGESARWDQKKCLGGSRVEVAVASCDGAVICGGLVAGAGGRNRVPTGSRSGPFCVHFDPPCLLVLSLTYPRLVGAVHADCRPRLSTSFLRAY